LILIIDQSMGKTICSIWMRDEMRWEIIQ
jgi:hypothetical protein